MTQKGPELHVSPGGEKAQVFTVRKGGVNKVAGDGALTGVTVVLCVTAGSITVVWNDGTSDDIAFLAGGVLGLHEAATVTVLTTAKFHVM